MHFAFITDLSNGLHSSNSDAPGLGEGAVVQVRQDSSHQRLPERLQASNEALTNVAEMTVSWVCRDHANSKNQSTIQQRSAAVPATAKGSCVFTIVMHDSFQHNAVLFDVCQEF